MSYAILEAIGLAGSNDDASTARERLARAVGDKIKARMEALGLNQSELSRRANTSRHNVSTWVNGKFVPRREALVSVAEALECEVDDLYPSLDDLRPAATNGVGPFQFILEQGGMVRVDLHDTLPLDAAVEISQILARVKGKQTP